MTSKLILQTNVSIMFFVSSLVYVCLFVVFHCQETFFFSFEIFMHVIWSETWKNRQSEETLFMTESALSSDIKWLTNYIYRFAFGVFISTWVVCNINSFKLRVGQKPVAVLGLGDTFRLYQFEANGLPEIRYRNDVVWAWFLMKDRPIH